MFVNYVILRFIHVDMWRSWLRRQSSNPEVVGSSPAGGEKLAVGGLSQVGFVRGLYPLATHFTPPR